MKKHVGLLLIISSLMLASCSSGEVATSSSKATGLSTESSEVTSHETGLSTEESSEIETSEEESSEIETSAEETSEAEDTSHDTGLSTEEDTSAIEETSHDTGLSTEEDTSAIEETSHETGLSTAEDTSATEETSHETGLSTEETSGEGFSKTINYKMHASLNKSIDDYDLSVEYSDSYFDTDAKEYNENLSLLSFASSVLTGNDKTAYDFYNEMGFGDFISFHYRETPTASTVGYVFATKDMGDYKLVGVGIRGFDYKSEWANNLLIGHKGNHEGFNERATDIFEMLQVYINDNVKVDSDEPIKIWISGYSRAGAISISLADKIMRSEDFEIAQEDLFVYTFESPSSIDVENLAAYKNVHNIYNAADIVTYVPPVVYGLGRSGVDYEIYVPNLYEVLAEFDPDMGMEQFKPFQVGLWEINNSIDLCEMISYYVFSNPDTAEEYSAATRTDYVNHYQDGFTYMLDLIWKLSSSTLNALVEDLKGQGFNILSLLSSGQALATYLMPFLDSDGISYDEKLLTEACQDLVDALINLFMPVFALYLSEDYRPALISTISMHFPEVTYALLLNAHRK